MTKKHALIAPILLTLSLAACTLPGAQQTPELPALTATPTTFVQPTVQLAPTLSFNTLVPPTLASTTEGTIVAQATAGGAGGPTALPAPTQIGVALTPTQVTTQGTADPNSTQQPTSTAPAPNVPTGPGISINPQLGEPGDVVMVDGSGFKAGEKVSFSWAPADKGAPMLPDNYSMDADSSGKVVVGLKVPAANKWPGGGAEENELIQLRATAESLGFNYYYANFKYVKRFNVGTTLAQVFKNPNKGYQISVPDGWTWSWDGDHTENVRFAGPGGKGKGFVRALDTTDVNAAITSVMSAEGLTASSSAQKTLGNYTGTEVATTGGGIVWFIPIRSRVYALSFTDASGAFFAAIAASIQIQ